jgi:hypothetical protein
VKVNRRQQPIVKLRHMARRRADNKAVALFRLQWRM